MAKNHSKLCQQGTALSGWGEEGKKEVEKSTFPTLLTMIVALNNLAQQLFSVEFLTE